MTQPILSPAAQAAMKAFNSELRRQTEAAICQEQMLVAATLRAVADQPYMVPPRIKGDAYWHYRAGVDADRERIMAIANELEQP